MHQVTGPFLKQSLPPSPFPHTQVSAAGLGGAGMREGPREHPSVQELVGAAEVGLLEGLGAGRGGAGCQAVTEGPRPLAAPVSIWCPGPGRDLGLRPGRPMLGQ